MRDSSNEKRIDRLCGTDSGTLRKKGIVKEASLVSQKNLSAAHNSSAETVSKTKQMNVNLKKTELTIKGDESFSNQLIPNKGKGILNSKSKGASVFKALQRNTANNIVTVQRMTHRTIIKGDDKKGKTHDIQVLKEVNPGQQCTPQVVGELKKSIMEPVSRNALLYNETINSDGLPSYSTYGSQDVDDVSGNRSATDDCGGGYVGMFDVFTYFNKAFNGGLCGCAEVASSKTKDDQQKTHSNAISWTEDPSVISMDTDANISDVIAGPREISERIQATTQSDSADRSEAHTNQRLLNREASSTLIRDPSPGIHTSCENVETTKTSSNRNSIKARFSKEKRQQGDSSEVDDVDSENDSENESDSESDVSAQEARDKVSKEIVSQNICKLKQNYKLTITVDHGKGKELEDVTIDMNSVHFSGWDGDRSHYSLAISPVANAIQIHRSGTKRNQLGKNFKKKSKSLRAEDLLSVEGSQLSALSADVHPLRQHKTVLKSHQSPKKVGFEAQSVSKISPIVHLYRDNKKDFDSITAVSANSDEDESVTGQSKSLSSQIFSLLSKLNETPKSERQKKKKKERFLDDVLDPRVTPMGEEESEMILGFLGSESGSSTVSEGDNDDDKRKHEEKFQIPTPTGTSPLNKAISVQGHKANISHNPYSLPRPLSASSETVFFSSQKSYVLEQQHGTIFLKASPNTKPAKSPKLLIKKRKKKKKAGGYHESGIFLEPGWRSAAARDIPRAVSCSDSAPDVSPLLVDEYSPAVRVMNLFGIRKTQDHSINDSPAAATEEPQRSCMLFPFFRNESLNVNLFGSPEPDMSGRRYGLAETNGKQIDCSTLARKNIFGSYIRQCSPTFDSRLRLQNRVGQRKKCILEGWTLFLIGNEDFSLNRGVPNKNWLRYVVLNENSSTIFAYDSIGPNAKSKSIDLSRGRIAIPTVVSTRLGYAVLLKSETTNKTLCTILPIPISDKLFLDESLNRTVDQAQFEKSWTELQITLTRSEKKGREHMIWGDPLTINNFAPLEQHNAFLHLYYVIDAVIHSASSSNLKVWTF